MIADSAFKRMQVDARACWLDTGEHHRGLALRTSRALNCNEWNDGRRVGHDASLEQAGARHSLSPVLPWRRSGDCLRRLSNASLIREVCARKVGTSHSGAPVTRCGFCSPTARLSSRVSFFAFKRLIWRLANFVHRNDRQHSKDRESHHHRSAPSAWPTPIVSRGESFRRSNSAQRPRSLSTAWPKH
jgi:hypothetical protein